MTEKEIQEIGELLSSHKKIAISTHQFPDGDAMGSSLALYHYLKLKGHGASVVVPTYYPDFLHWMPGDEEVINYMTHQHRALDILNEAEVLFCLDYNIPGRTKGLADAVENFSGTKILIDHHPDPGDFVDYKLSVIEASSTAELIYEFMAMLNDERMINRDIASCIYTGILTDTGSFAYGSTTYRAHYIAGEMIKAGADNLQIQNEVFNSNSEDRVRLMGFALSDKLTIVPELNAGYITLSVEELDRFNFQNGDTEGLVNHVLSIKGVCFAVLMLEREKSVKCSFRSLGQFPSNRVARNHFNGGGHMNASGGEYYGSLAEAEQLLQEVLPQYKEQLIE